VVSATGGVTTERVRFTGAFFAVCVGLSGSAGLSGGSKQQPDFVLNPPQERQRFDRQLHKVARGVRVVVVPAVGGLFMGSAELALVLVIYILFVLFFDR